MLIVDENDGYQLTLGSCGAAAAAPYMCQLAAQYASAGDWYGVEHPSLPNYLDLISGGDQGCTGDGCMGPYRTQNLGAQLSAAAIPWTAYMESMPSHCFKGASAGEYQAKHNPFMDFPSVAQGKQCRQVDQPYPGDAGIAAALDAAGAPDFVWVSPNSVSDMHDSNVQTGDVWLHSNLPAILQSSWFADHGTVIVTMDENDVESHGGCCTVAHGGQIPELVISAAAEGKGTLPLTGDHFGTLRSIEEAYGLPLLGGAANPGNGDLSSLIG